MTNNYLDDEERDLEIALDMVDISSLSRPDERVQDKFKTAASTFTKKETKMNIRIDPLELEAVKKQAAIEGLKYQTFVKSVLHKYISGQLVEKSSR